MKKLKRFQIFRRFESSNYNEPEKQLVDQLDNNFIDEYYNENYGHDIEDILDIFPSIVWNNIDDDKFVEDYIDDDVNSFSLDDIDEDDMRSFIENNYSDNIEKRILYLYAENNDLKKQIKSKNAGKVTLKDKKNKTIVFVDSKKYEITHDYLINVRENDVVQKDSILAQITYEDFMFDELDEDNLRSIIENENLEDDCIREVVEKRYKDDTAEDIINNIYGTLSGKDLYRIVSNYIDDDAIIEQYKDGEDDEFKTDFVKGCISNDKDLQEKLLELDSKNSILLADVFIESHSDSNRICDEYDFQNAYIESKVSEFIEEEGYEESEYEKIKEELIDEIGHVRATAVKFLSDNFGLNSDIEYEYEDDMWLLNSDKYNI